MKVILYTAPACPFCVIVKKYLERNNVTFKEIDISKDKKAEEEMQKKSDQTKVPVIDIDGKIVIGYNLQKLNEALNLK
jgi:glutaredoxin-like YruB-family protein